MIFRAIHKESNTVIQTINLSQFQFLLENGYSSDYCHFSAEYSVFVASLLVLSNYYHFLPYLLNNGL